MTPDPKPGDPGYIEPIPEKPQTEDDVADATTDPDAATDSGTKTDPPATGG